MAEPCVIIVAAGSGTRFGTGLPKQYCKLKGKPVLMHTVESFRKALPNAEICLVISSDMADYWQELCERHQFTSPRTVPGGATRTRSVENALNAAAEISADTAVLIHDGARPLISPELIRRVVKGLEAEIKNAADADSVPGIIPVTEVTDSLQQVNEDGTLTAVDRSRFRAVQTPQAFTAGAMRRAYTNYNNLPHSFTPTDDASLCAAAGTVIKFVPGEVTNIKITNPRDLLIAEVLSESE
ncbi:MAG: 2-C-methyl-D-erythritol 4-phosphate cytidylyltransferase [Muribaculaceae bacterium]|nr:2-C-methyl-D-erythritol 4-phosphate cytidylyltransferase [Muribaculaceae bacterium]